MNRRAFIKRSLTAAIATAVGVPVAKAMVAAIEPAITWVPNPAYAAAPIEIEMLMARECERMRPHIINALTKPSPFLFALDEHPLRFEFNQGEVIKKTNT